LLCLVASLFWRVLARFLTENCPLVVKFRSVKVPCMAVGKGSPRRSPSAPESPEDGCDGCAGCVLLRRRVAQLAAELAAFKSGHQEVARLPQRPPRVDKWRPTAETPLLQEYFACRQLPWETSRGRAQLQIVHGDLVSADEMFKMHFVSADMKRSKGIALRLAEVFGPVAPSQNQNEIGAIQQQQKDGKNLLNLVTKRRYFHKPAANPERFLANIVTALVSLREYCKDTVIRRIALPRVGSNLDRVNWHWTQRKLLEIFADVDIELVVYLGDRQSRRPAARRQQPPGSQPVARQQSISDTSRQPPPSQLRQPAQLPSRHPPPPDSSSRTAFPPLGGPGSRVRWRKRQQAGLRQGKGADACGDSVLAGRPEASVESPALPEADNSAHDGASASARPSSDTQVSSHAPLLLDSNSDVSASLAHKLNDCFVLLKRLSLAAGVDAVRPRMDVSSQTPRRLSADEISKADDECLLLQERSVPETPDERLPAPLLPTLQRQEPLAGQTF
jgi:hypothetical protein